jgi:hypothetical protein
MMPELGRVLPPSPPAGSYTSELILRESVRAYVTIDAYGLIAEDHGRPSDDGYLRTQIPTTVFNSLSSPYSHSLLDITLLTPCVVSLHSPLYTRFTLSTLITLIDACDLSHALRSVLCVLLLQLLQLHCAFCSPFAFTNTRDARHGSG